MPSTGYNYNTHEASADDFYGRSGYDYQYQNAYTPLNDYVSEQYGQYSQSKERYDAMAQSSAGSSNYYALRPNE